MGARAMKIEPWLWALVTALAIWGWARRPSEMCILDEVDTNGANCSCSGAEVEIRIVSVVGGQPPTIVVEDRQGVRWAMTLREDSSWPTERFFFVPKRDLLSLPDRSADVGRRHSGQI